MNLENEFSDYNSNNNTNDDNEQSELEIEFNKYNQIISLYDKLDRIYNDVIYNYQQGKSLVYHPDIFKNLTKSVFMDWVIDNNPKLFVHK